MSRLSESRALKNTVFVVMVVVSVRAAFVVFVDILNSGSRNYFELFVLAAFIFVSLEICGYYHKKNIHVSNSLLFFGLFVFPCLIIITILFPDVKSILGVIGISYAIIFVSGILCDMVNRLVRLVTNQRWGG